MNVAIITPGILPVPPVKGGAVETLIDYYISDNKHTNNISFFILGRYDKKADSKSKDGEYNLCKFIYYYPNSINHRIKRYFFKKRNRDYYYDYYTDYYGEWAINKIKDLNIDLVIIENRQGFTINAAKRLNIPIILHLHTDTLNKDSYKASEIVDSCDKIITVSGYLKKQVDSITTQSKSEVIYNGIDLDKYIAPTKIYSRKDFGLNDNDFVVIYTGRLVSVKGIKELIKAFKLIKDYKSIKLLIVGGANFGDENKDNSFTKEIKQNLEEIAYKIIFTGYITYENIPSILKIADIGIIPSIWEEALSLTSLEGMASELPLIVTRSGGIPEAVDEKCAIILEKDNLDELPNLLAKAIINLYENPERRKEMSNYAGKRSKLFSKKLYIKEIIQLINNFK